MKTTGHIFKERLHSSDPGTGYGDESREHHTCTATALDYTQLASGIWVPTFDGSTTKIDTGSAWMPVGDISVGGWFYAIGWGESAEGHILADGKLYIDIEDSGDRFVVSSDGGGTFKNSANSSVALTTWTYFFVTRTLAGLVNIYLNAVLSGTANQTSGTPAAGTTNVIIGNRDTDNRTFDGYISGLEIYNYIPSSPTTFAAARYNEKALLYGRALI